MPLAELQRLLQSIEPAAHLVERRVLRRVVRLDRRLQGLRLVIPHDFSYTIDRDRLFAFIELSELQLLPGSDLPRRVILLAQPDEDELHDAEHWQELVERYCRLLFHACVHLEMEKRLLRDPVDPAIIGQRQAQIGAVEFAEITDVLQKENLLFQPVVDLEAYIEFAAVSLELKYFAPGERTVYFPAIRDWDQVDQVLNEDLNHDALFQRMLLIHTARGPSESTSTSQSSLIVKFPQLLRKPVSAAAYRQLQARADASSALGNNVKAALSHLRAALRAPAEFDAEGQAAADLELSKLTYRLQAVFQFSDQQRDRWRAALQPLLAPAAQGFWSTEARLLYDLQKVCSEQERGIYRLDLVDWIRTLGRRPVRRSLPLMKDALTLRHLRTVQRRIAPSRITVVEKLELSQLLESVLPIVENRSRDRLRAIIVDVLDEVGLIPQNVLEEVARKKLVEELLDRIGERSYFTMGDLRDAISKNDLKLPDVTTISELAFGDCVLRADRKFEAALDGIYRRGAIYLRWPQTLSSLFFGTNFGRMLTRHVFIPFGGAYLIIEFVHHMIAMFSGQEDASQSTEAVIAVAEKAPHHFDFMLWSGVLLMGAWISLLIHRPEFRAWNLRFLVTGWKTVRHVSVEVPSQVINSEPVQKVLASRTFAVIRNYVLEPALIVSLMTLGALFAGYDWKPHLVFDLYLIMALFLNSPVGRFVSEWTVDLMVRAWHEFKMHVFSAMLQFVVDIFDWLLVSLERVVYTVDEWLRFRTGDDGPMRWVKLAGGVVWFFVSYVVVFIFTLLVEPQINPIKHFPVVTVSHKIIFSQVPEFVRRLAPILGKSTATSVVLTTIWLIPGVFGFLFWELKENWRLYAANRSRKFKPEAIGHHGETMLRLLRPGFHSGTLPKAFSTLRRFLRKGLAGGESRASRTRASIHHVEEAVKHFVERELIALLSEVGFLDGVRLHVQHVHAATNRIELELVREDRPDEPARIAWELINGRLIGQIQPPGWILELSLSDHSILITGLEQLFQLSGVEEPLGPIPVSVTPAIIWDDAVAYWTAVRDSGHRESMGIITTGLAAS